MLSQLPCNVGTHKNEKPIKLERTDLNEVYMVRRNHHLSK